jgi:hypothetical protein
MPLLLASCASDDGLMFHEGDQAFADPDIGTDSEEEGDDEDNDARCKVSIRSGALQEKVAAVLSPSPSPTPTLTPSPSPSPSPPSLSLSLSPDPANPGDLADPALPCFQVATIGTLCGCVGEPMVPYIEKTLLALEHLAEYTHTPSPSPSPSPSPLP